MRSEESSVKPSECARIACVVLMLAPVTANPAHAQEGERRGFVGLGIGPSTPIGSFADASTTIDGSGRTVTGYTSTLLNLGYRFRNRLGVAVAFSYSEYAVADEGDDDWWQVAGVTVGPLHSILLGPRLALDLKAMAGMIVLTPVEDSYATYGGEGTGLGVDVRATLRYDVFRRWAIFADAGLQSSTSSLADYHALISGLGAAFRPSW